MSKPLIRKLQALLDSGELLDLVDKVLACKQLLPYLGYSTELDRYIPIIRQYLIDNDVYIGHWTHNGLPKAPEKQYNCINCNSVFTVRGAYRLGKQKTCSYSCATKVYRNKEQHPNYKDGRSSYRAEALLTYENKCRLCGYSDNIAALEVHHIDKDRTNNSISNLEILCANCHAIEHRG